MITETFAAFAAFILFVLHEFEEIIRCRPWIDRHQSEARYAHDMWVRNRRAYPSTETVAALILEEIILAAAILIVSAFLNYSPLIFAVIFGNSVHLAVHCFSAIATRAWNPGSITAAVTLPCNAAILVVLWSNAATEPGIGVKSFIITSLALLIALGANLSMLHRIAPGLDKHIQGEDIADCGIMEGASKGGCDG